MKEIKQGFLWTIGAILAGITIAVVSGILIWISFRISSVINPYNTPYFNVIK